MRWVVLLALVALLVPVALWIFVVSPFGELLPEIALWRPKVIQPGMKKLVDLSFDEVDGRLSGWEEKVFKGKTVYEAQLDADGDGMLSARSSDASSALFRKVDVPIDVSPWLVWRWKSPVFPTNKKTMDLASQEDNDFAGRVYVIFKSRSIFSADVIEYVWDDRFAEGTVSASPFSDHIRVSVVRSGVSAADGWIVEKRDVVRDYTAFFGKPPRRNIAAVAIMSDSDNTKSQSGILIKNITLATAETAVQKDKEGGAE